MRMIVATAGVLAIWAAGARSADDALVADLSGRLGGRPGLIVHIGAGAGDLGAALAAQPGRIVHGLEPDASAVARSREAAAKAGLCGRLTVEQGALTSLPYVTHLANALVIDDWTRVSAAGLKASEALRVLAPFGVGIVGQSARHGGDAEPDAIRAWLAEAGMRDAEIVRKDGVWAIFTKARPDGMDVWTHKWRDGSRNHASQDRLVGVPAALHWINSTAYTWSLRQYRATQNRVFYFFYNQGGLSRWGHRKKPTQTIEAYDAYSGVSLWSREIPESVSSFGPIALEDRIILTTREGTNKVLKALSAATGEDLLTYAEAGIPADGAVDADTLAWVRADLARGVDVKTGKVLWERSAAAKPEWVKGKGAVTGFEEYCIVAADGLVFLAERTRGEDRKIRTRLIGLDLRTGEEKWSSEHPLLGGGYQKYFYHAGRLLLSVDAGYLSLPVSSGGEPWHLPVTAVDKKGATTSVLGGHASKSAFGIGDRIWAREGGQFRLVIGPEADMKRLEPAKTWVAFDAATGREARRVGYEVGGGWQQRCFPDLGCPAFIISSNNEFVDLKTGGITQNRGLRGNCGEGPFFGNGLYYMTPHYCCFCYPMVRGGIAMGGGPPPSIPIADASRFEKGPAWTGSGSSIGSQQSPIGNDGWPMYRATPRRVGGTTAAVETPLAEKPVWRRDFGAHVCQAIAADRRVYATVVNEGRVCALDPETGASLWEFAAGGRIDTPPTFHAGQLLFGCHDGSVYALRAADGALAWRFRAAPEERRMLVRDRVESSWPVPGAVLVDDGVLYCMAGRITSCDGGMCLYALDAVSGAMKWRRNVRGSNHPALQTGINCWHEPQGELCNAILLKRDGDILLTDQHMYWRFRADTGEQVMPETTNSTLELTLFDEKTPWLGMDRPTWQANFNGENMLPEIRFPYGNGTPACFPEPAALGLVCKRLRSERVMQFFPSKAAQIAERWEHEKKAIAFEWAPWRSKVDVHAFCAAGDTVFFAGPEFDPATSPPTAELRALSLRTGADLGFGVRLHAPPVYDGLSVAYGKVLVALEDGALLCFAE